MVTQFPLFLSGSQKFFSFLPRRSEARKLNTYDTGDFRSEQHYDEIFSNLPPCYIQCGSLKFRKRSDEGLMWWQTHQTRSNTISLTASMLTMWSHRVDRCTENCETRIGYEGNAFLSMKMCSLAEKYPRFGRTCSF